MRNSRLSTLFCNFVAKLRNYFETTKYFANFFRIIFNFLFSRPLGSKPPPLANKTGHRSQQDGAGWVIQVITYSLWTFVFSEIDTNILYTIIYIIIYIIIYNIKLTILLIPLLSKNLNVQSE